MLSSSLQVLPDATRTDQIDPGVGAMGVPGEIGLVILAADKVYNDPRTTACIASFTNELALDAEETRELCGKPYHYVG